MKRDLKAMAGAEHDLLIVGGGITGACIAWDAALRGLKVALVEKRDFSSGTSAGSSKLVHGGLRYLRNFEFGLIRESLRERRVWEVIAPHQVAPLAFLLPTGAGPGTGRMTLHAGLTLYDLLSYDRNDVPDPDKRMPGHRFVSGRDARRREPVLDGLKLSGGMLYYDCQMLSPERLGLEALRGAAERGAHVANYAAVTDFLKDASGVRPAVKGAVVRDELTGSTYTIRAALTVNAAGPWADRLLSLASETPSHTLIRSKGIHLIVPALTRGHALTLTVPKSHGGGHLFVLPWRGVSIIGTTDTVFNDDPDDLSVSEADIESLLGVLNASLPQAKMTRAQVLHAYAGLRPLIDESGKGTGDSYNASRKSEVVDHGQTDGVDGLLSAIGGKWTTTRHVAEQAVTMALKRLSKPEVACVTATMTLPAGSVGRLSQFAEHACARYPGWTKAQIKTFAQAYGARLDEMMGCVRDDPALGDRLTAERAHIGAQAAYAATHEMARTVEDVLFRRTDLGMFGHPGRDVVTQVGRIMGERLGWDSAEIARQTDEAERLFFAGPAR